MKLQEKQGKLQHLTTNSSFQCWHSVSSIQQSKITDGKYAKDSWIRLSGLVWLKGYITGEQKKKNSPPSLEQVDSQHKRILTPLSLSDKHKTWTLDTNSNPPFAYQSVKAIISLWAQQDIVKVRRTFHPPYPSFTIYCTRV